MINKVDFENLRGRYSNVLGAVKPAAKTDKFVKYLENFDAAIKPMVGKYEEVDVLIKLTYKNLKGEVKTIAYRPIQKAIEIPEDAVYYYSTIKVVAKVGEIIFETKENNPLLKTQMVYVEENLTARQQESLKEKIKKRTTASSMASMEQIEEYGRGFITFKPLKNKSATL